MTLNLNALENLMRFREFTFERADGDEIPVVCSTDVEVARDGYLEVLEHTPAAVNLERAPLPLIDGHRRDSGPFGIVEQLRVAAGKLRGVVRFGNTARAKELLADVKAGILRSVSVAYSIDKYRMEGARLIATRWTPFELSTVTVPADPGAGFYRSAEEVMEIQEERDRAAAEGRGEHESDDQQRIGSETRLHGASQRPAARRGWGRCERVAPEGHQRHTALLAFSALCLILQREAEGPCPVYVYCWSCACSVSGLIPRLRPKRLVPSNSSLRPTAKLALSVLVLGMRVKVIIDAEGHWVVEAGSEKGPFRIQRFGPLWQMEFNGSIHVYMDTGEFYILRAKESLANDLKDLEESMNGPINPFLRPVSTPP